MPSTRPFLILIANLQLELMSFSIFPSTSSDLASMDIEDGGAGLEYNPMDAQGFIRINAVRLRANYLIRSHGSK